MSIDEKSRHIAQPHLLPGETLAWAGPATAPPRPTRFVLQVGAATFLGIVVLGTGGAMLVGELTSSAFLLFMIAGILLGAFTGAMVPLTAGTFDYLHKKPTHYAITDRRILFFSMLNTEEGWEILPVSAYGPQDIQCVRRQDRPDGMSDLLIRQADGPRRLGPDGVAVAFQAPTPEVALRGVAEGGAVAALIEALRSGVLAAPAAAPVVAPAAAAVALVSPPVWPRGEREILLKKSAIVGPGGVISLLFGLIFLGAGIAAGLGLTAVQSGEGALATPAPSLAGLLGLGGMGLLFSLFGLGMILRRDIFTANPVTRTYRLLCGYVPFAKPVVGTFADFECIRLTREDDSESQDKIWHVRLHWKEEGRLHWKVAGRKPYSILATPFALHATGEAARMAAALGLPLDDRSDERTPTEKKAQAVRADPRTPERTARGRRLKTAGSVALGLLLVNSFVKGVVWEEHWTAPDGSAITRRTTGFWGQTVAISPQGRRSSQTIDQYFFYTSSAGEGTLPDISGPRTNYRRGLRLGSQLAADDAPASQLAAGNAPGSKSATRRFQYYNKYDRPKGPRYWTRISPLEWQEKYENGMTTKFRVERRTQVGGDAGITARKQDGTNIWVFIPDRGSRKMRLRFRYEGQPGWTDLGEMTHIQ